MSKIGQLARFLPPLGWLVASVGFASGRAGDPAPPAVAPNGFQGAVAPFLAKHCSGCHNAEKKKGDLILDRFTDEAEALKAARVWEDVISRVEAKEMPPRTRPQPTLEEWSAALPWLRHAASGSGAADHDPGRVTMRRLNRIEYRNTIRDLLGVDFEPSQRFPSDDVGYGFDNIGDVLSLPPILLEKYLSAAEEIAVKAIGDGRPAKSDYKRFEGEDMECTSTKHEKRGNKRCLYTEGELHAKFLFREDGAYLLSARSIADQAGDALVKMSFRVDGKDLQTVEVEAVEGKAKTYEARIQVAAGERSFGVAFLNDYTAPPEPEKSEKSEKTDRKGADRNLLVDWVEVEGPLDAKTKNPPSHARLLPCDPRGPEKEACLRKSISAFVTRAYRRPAANEEVERLLALIRAAEAEESTPEEGFRLAVEAVLVSPHFLFRVELDPEPTNPERAHSLNDFELASRLSYFLWQAPPDDKLFGLALNGELQKEGALSAQALRLLRDPKASALTESFCGQWLTIRNLATVTPDRARFPSFDDELRDAMRRETELFFEAVVREDRSVLELLDANYTFLNERLAKHYGISGVEGAGFRRVALTDGRRGGVLTQASVLTVTSNPTRTSPVKRGKWVLEQILGTPPPPPPPNVPELKDDPSGPLTGTLRQRMEQHRRDPNCSTCHAKMDALGFGLESFDAVGAWREADGGAPLDASGELPDGRKFAGPADLKRVLLGDEVAFTRALAEKLLTFALGRGVERSDRRAVDAIAERARAGGNKFSTFVLAIVESEPFRLRRGERKRG